MYADFRPDVNGWGQRGEVKCRTILEMRSIARGSVQEVKEERDRKNSIGSKAAKEPEFIEEPRLKKVKTSSDDEYEDAFDLSAEFEDFINNTDF